MQLVSILCPLDFSGATPPQLAYAAELAAATGAVLCLLHVQPTRPTLADTDSAALAQLRHWQQQATQRGARRVVLALRSGEAGPEIVQAAQEQTAGLVVIGSHGQTGLTRFLVGSTAEYVVRHAPGATLLIKPTPPPVYRQLA